MLPMDEDSQKPNGFLYRYTALPSLFDLLQNSRLTLLDPEGWSDRNDVFYLKQFQSRREARSVLALCFTDASETFHHWNVYANGASGVRIHFNREALLGSLGKLKDEGKILYGSVDYIPLNDARTPDVSQLPFLKRYPYRDEKEFRIIYIDQGQEVQSKYIPLDPLDKVVNRVTLSPALPKELTETIKSAIRQCAGWDVPVSRTTIFDNTRWRNLGQNAL